MSEFLGFAEEGTKFYFPIITDATANVAEEPDAAPEYTLYSISGSTVTAVASSVALTQVGSVDGYYYGTADTSALSLSAGTTYYIRVTYDISSTTYTKSYMFQVV